jgi:hypothetical protein
MDNGPPGIISDFPRPEARPKTSTRDSAIQVAQIRVKRRAAQRAHRAMRERAAQALNPEMGRMGAEDPSTAFRPRL